jgi:hypothetical protein
MALVVAASAEQAGLLVTPEEEGESLVQETFSSTIAPHEFCPRPAHSELESGSEVAYSRVRLVGTLGSFLGP